MTYVSSIESVIVELRKTLANQAEISIDDVINADSIRGAELTHVVNDVLIPYTAKDDVIVFELVESSDFDIDMEKFDETLEDVSAHQLNLVIYGDNSRTLARKLKSRMWSQKVVNDLSLKGISISSISDITSTTEFINTIRYLRRDMTITFICAMNFEPISEYHEIEDGNINVKST